MWYPFEIDLIKHEGKNIFYFDLTVMKTQIEPLVREWCLDHLSEGGWNFVSQNYLYTRIVFSNEADKMAFTLRWL